MAYLKLIISAKNVKTNKNLFIGSYDNLHVGVTIRSGAWPVSYIVSSGGGQGRGVLTGKKIDEDDSMGAKIPLPPPKGKKSRNGIF